MYSSDEFRDLALHLRTLTDSLGNVRLTSGAGRDGDGLRHQPALGISVLGHGLEVGDVAGVAQQRADFAILVLSQTGNVRRVFC